MHIKNEIIASFIEGTLSGGEREKLLAHLDQCEICFEKVTAVMEVETKGDQKYHTNIDPSVRRTAVKMGKHNRMRSFNWSNLFKPNLRIALAFGISAIFAITFIITSGFDEDSYRGENGFIQTETPHEGEIITKGSLRFKWEKEKSALNYNFILYNETGEVLVRKSLKKTSIDLNNKVILPPDKSYLWEVEVILSNGKRKRTGLNSFKLVNK